jgi:hypothetical protein
MEILMDDEMPFYYHNTTIIPYGSKNVKNSWNKKFNFFNLTIHDNKKFTLSIFYGNKKNWQFSKMHFNTMCGKKGDTPSEGIRKKYFYFFSWKK